MTEAELVRPTGILLEAKKRVAHTGLCYDIAGPILGLCPANERRRYKVTPSLIGWAQI